MTWPEANGEWWREKIERTRRRDRDTDRSLRSHGWEIVRVWEHADLEGAAQRIAETVATRLRDLAGAPR